MDLDSAAEEERRREDWEAAERTKMEELEEAGRWEEGFERGGVEEEVEELAGGVGVDQYKWEEKGEAIGREGWRQRNQREPVGVRQRAAWRGRGGGRGGRRGRGGFQFHRSWCGAVNPQPHIPDISNKPGVYGGAIIICNRLTKRDFFQYKLFALPGYATTFIKKIRVGMLLFLFEFEERKLYGVFEAASDGTLDILPDAFASLWKFRPAQVLFRRVWFCKPLTVAEFSGAIEGNSLKPHMSFLGISYQQVLNLVDLFSLKMIQLQAFQKPKPRVLSDYKISLARTGQEFGLQTYSNACHSRPTMFHKNRTSLPHRPFMYAKHHNRRATHENDSTLHPCPKPVVFKAAKRLEPNDDYIPLELDDPDDYRFERDADQSNLLGTVRLHSTLKSTVKYEDPITKPLSGKHSEHDSYHSHLLNRSIFSECETGQKNVGAHTVKEIESSLQNKGCKRKATVQLDELSDVLCSRRVSSAAKKVSFNIGGNEVSVTSGRKFSSDKSMCMPGCFENRDRVVEKGKEEVCFSPQDIKSKESDVSARRSKRMSLSFTERLRKQLDQSCSRNGQSLVAQAGIKLTCTLLTD